jgi:hypothetical protein
MEREARKVGKVRSFFRKKKRAEMGQRAGSVVLHTPSEPQTNPQPVVPAQLQDRTQVHKSDIE